MKPPPRFNNGTPLFTSGQARPAKEMVRSWGTFVRTGSPHAACRLGALVPGH
ncbi:hypothetical protein [Streptomyces sp. NPDC057909]|uniref:hypothetical protein n=1 Tax=Streptomyces sp. NPDC057909 TaxID=3346277 RepID=UPI0036E1AC49